MALPKPVIQSMLPGLLSLLGIRNGGALPPVLADQVVPTFDLDSWYLRAQLRFSAPAASYSTNGAQIGGFTSFVTNQATLQVPNSEWWYVDGYWISAQMNAVDTLSRVQHGLLLPGSVAIPAENSFRTSGDAAAPISATTHFLARSFWAPPGSELVFSALGALTLGTSTIYGRCRYVPLAA
jgi:hypothetical protein